MKKWIVLLFVLALRASAGDVEVEARHDEFEDKTTVTGTLLVNLTPSGPVGVEASYDYAGKKPPAKVPEIRTMTAYTIASDPARIPRAGDPVEVAWRFDAKVRVATTFKVTKVIRLSGVEWMLVSTAPLTPDLREAMLKAKSADFRLAGKSDGEFDAEQWSKWKAFLTKPPQQATTPK
jgi:hypothetical protein